MKRLLIAGLVLIGLVGCKHDWVWMLGIPKDSTTKVITQYDTIIAPSCMDVLFVPFKLEIEYSVDIETKGFQRQRTFKDTLWIAPGDKINIEYYCRD